jgi:hypothetical protein
MTGMAPPVARRLGLALAVSSLFAPALAHLGAQENVVECDLVRGTPESVIGCFVLEPSSPYNTAGIAGSRIGADAALMTRLVECVRTGDSVSPACQEWETARAADAVMCID